MIEGLRHLLRTPTWTWTGGRNLYDPERMAELGFEYHLVGRTVMGVG